jgi:hypothetical protein
VDFKWFGKIGLSQYGFPSQKLFCGLKKRSAVPVANDNEPFLKSGHQ